MSANMFQGIATYETRTTHFKTDAEPLLQITCLYDMDIPRPDNFNECYLYEGAVRPTARTGMMLTEYRTHGVRFGRHHQVWPAAH